MNLKILYFKELSEKSEFLKFAAQAWDFLDISLRFLSFWGSFSYKNVSKKKKRVHCFHFDYMSYPQNKFCILINTDIKDLSWFLSICWGKFCFQSSLIELTLLIYIVSSLMFSFYLQTWWLFWLGCPYDTPSVHSFIAAYSPQFHCSV